LQDHISVDALVEDSILRDSHTPLVRSARMASHSDMSDLLAILAKCDEYESYISCYSSDCPPTFSPPLWSSDYCHEVESGVVDTLYCKCVECLSCRSLFELGSFCPGC
jgi:hypothetical protein